MDESLHAEIDFKKSPEKYPEFEFVLAAAKSITIQERKDETKILLDEKKLRSMVEKTRTSEKKDGPHKPIPEFQKRSRRATEDAILIAINNNLISSRLLHDTARFSVPKNVTVSDQKHSVISRERLFAVKEESYTPLSFPDTRKQRDENVEVIYGEQAVSEIARQYMELVKELDISLTDEECIDIALLETAAHEHLGHALEYAMTARGESFLELKNEIDALYGIYGFDEEERKKIFGEHWARGMEEWILGYYLTQNLGLSDADKDRIMTLRNKSSKNYSDSFKKVLLQLQAPNNVKKPETALLIYKCIAEFCRKNYGSDDPSIASDVANWPPVDIVAYNDRAFNVQQMISTVAEAYYT